MRHYQAMLPKGMWRLWVLLVFNALIHVGLPTASTVKSSSGLSDQEDGEHVFVSEKFEYQTYIILYKDAANDQNVVNCTAPLNVTLPVMESNMLQKWTAPSGVHLMMTSPHEDSNASGKAGQFQTADRGNVQKPWVELTSDSILVFHNPDDSVAGAYVCQSTADNQVIYRTTVWVHVLRKNVFDVMERIKVAIIATVVFLACILGCWGAFYWCQRNKVRYTLAKRHEDHINIPTIQIVGVSEEKI